MPRADADYAAILYIAAAIDAYALLTMPPPLAATLLPPCRADAMPRRYIIDIDYFSMPFSLILLLTLDAAAAADFFFSPPPALPRCCHELFAAYAARTRGERLTQR